MLTKHLSRCMIAGIVALLPIGGFILSVVWAEASIANSGLSEQAFYFPGLGLLAVAGLLYVIGLVLTTFVGRWLWGRFEAVLETVPVLGQLYQTLKQLLGYGEGEHGLFDEVVLVPSRDTGGQQLGLVTSVYDESGDGERLVVFVPGAPNPTTGRLIVLARAELAAVDMSVNDALNTIVSVGKSPIGVVVADREVSRSPIRQSGIRESGSPENDRDPE